MSKVFLVTGASRGLGRRIAEAVLDAGDRLVAGARRPADLDDLALAYRDQVRVVALDVTDPTAAAAAIATAVREFGRLDVVVNNAGYADLASVEDGTLADFRAQIDTNLLGVVIVTKAALPVLRAQGGGHIVQISSVGGRLATAGLSAYQTAKWAVGGFSSVFGPGGRAPGHQGDRARTRRHAYRLGRVVDDRRAGQRAVRADRGRDGGHA